LLNGRATSLILMGAVLAGMGSPWAWPALLEGQEPARGVALQYSLGSAGGGIHAAGALSPRWGVRGGLHAMPRSFRSRFGGLDYSVTFPSPLLMVGVDTYPLGGSLRVSGGVAVLLDQVFLETGDLLMALGPDEVTVGTNSYAARRVGRVEAEVTGRSRVPWAGVGWGGNVARGRVEFFIDGGVALWGDPVVRIEAVGPERGNPVFQEDVEQERRAMEARFGRFSVYPLVLAGVSLPVFSGERGSGVRTP
jgi:hypothetical protein